MDSGSDGWCLIESDPGVFAALVEQLGVRGVSFSEVYSLDEETFAALEGPDAHSKVLGFVFLFNWARDKQEVGREGDAMPEDSVGEEEPFFAAQTVENACASQAIIAVLLNSQNEDIDIGGPLTALYGFTRDFNDPAMRGEAIGSCDAIREAHNSFRTDSSFEVQDGEGKVMKESFHFISYVPKGQKVFELDGLKKGPVSVARGDIADWKECVRLEILRRIESIQAQGEEHRFNLMAVITDPLLEINRKIAQTKGQMLSQGDHTLTSAAQQRISELEQQKQAEEVKRQHWKRENSRRRHDFTPFVLCALRHLARNGQLVELAKQAVAEAQTDSRNKLQTTTLNLEKN